VIADADTRPDTGLPVSVIVPVHNGRDYLPRTLPVLSALAASLKGELIVVNDGSTDGSAEIAGSSGATVLETGSRRGAARARNLGVSRARGDIIVFVDADVVPFPGAVESLLAHLRTGPYQAAFGSYAARFPARNFISRYQNLRHHFYHQRGHAQAESFWCGLGAVRRQAFVRAGGLDPAYEGIEDVELGARLRREGYRIRLDPACLGTHLKRWTLRSALHTDIFKRALPWSRLLCRHRSTSPTLNTARGERVRAAGALILLLVSCFAAAGRLQWIVPVLTACALGAANYRFAAFAAQRSGIAFAVAATLYHQLYYLYGIVVYAYCRIESWLTGGAVGSRTSAAPGGARS